MAFIKYKDPVTNEWKKTAQALQVLYSDCPIGRSNRIY